MSDTPLHIVGLKVENFKRIECVHIKPDGAIIPIVGKNGSGKTSILDSLESAFGGKDAFTKSPVRKGEKKAVIEVDLGELVLRRTISSNGTATFDLVGKEGENIRSPQKVMDTLYDKLTVDPVKFERMKPAEQRDIVSKLSGVDGEKFKARRETVFKRRTEVNRDEKAAATKVDDCKQSLTKRLAEAKLKVPPKEPVKVKDLMEELKKIDEHNAKIIDAQKAVSDAELFVKRKEREYADIERQVAMLEAQLAAEKDKLGVAKVDGEKCHKELDQIRKIREEMVSQDPAPIKEQITNAEGVNAAGKANAELIKASADHEKLLKDSESLSKQIEAIDAEYQAALSAAKMPIEGLSFDDTGVLFNELPFEEASSAERLRVSCAIAMSSPHRLRVILIRDGSLLDAESRVLLRDIAVARNYQVWMEIASSSEDEVGVRLVDGHVAEPKTQE